MISSAWLAAISGSGLSASNPGSDLDICISYLDALRTAIILSSSTQTYGTSTNATSTNATSTSTSTIDIGLFHNPNQHDMMEQQLQLQLHLLDQPPSHHPPPPPPSFSHHHNQHDTTAFMTCRRILIRILTTLSEVHAMKALRLGKAREWMEGANAYAHSYEHVNHALQMADEEYVNFLQLEEEKRAIKNTSNANHNHNDETQNTIQKQKQNLANDSNIIHVAISHFASDRELYTTLASKRIQYLKRKLAPQWSTRDEVKNKIGIERWNNNPNPKNTYSVLREEDERELKELVGSVDALESLETGGIEVKVKDIMNSVTNNNGSLNKNLNDAQIHGGGIYDEYKYNYNNNDDDDGGGDVILPNQFERRRRYNGIRPTHRNPLCPRVSIDKYPDPTNFNWIFTGSCDASFVEFYEMTTEDGSLVKLDFYYTTGSVKTSMDHPTQGPTQLFGHNQNNRNQSRGLTVSITPEIYRDILKNPRVHTDVRYQTRRNHPSQRRQGSNNGKNSNGTDNRNDNGGRGNRNIGNGRGSNRGGRGGIRMGGRGGSNRND